MAEGPGGGGPSGAQGSQRPGGGGGGGAAALPAPGGGRGLPALARGFPKCGCGTPGGRAIQPDAPSKAGVIQVRRMGTEGTPRGDHFTSALN
uniref:Uncharacterized protein n=1 Tax=Mus musculus TaxID=10090 RepID=Q3U1U3_MOUSE|nr:unnamed protein product [Mus musculus]